MENKFITDVAGMIKNKSAKKLIQAELESHILDKADYYKEIGYSEEEAIQKATEEMGDAEETAVPLNNLHNRKWYKTPANYITMIIFVLFFVCGNLFSSQLYDFSYLSLSFPNFTPHYILLDFISTVFFAFYIIVLHYARKNNNFLIPVLAVISLFFDFGYELGTVTLFEPMVYSVIIISTQGFTGYVDNIFNYSYAPEYYDFLYERLISAVIFLITIYAVLVFIHIFKKRYTVLRLKSKKYKTFETVIAILIAVNLAVMSICTTVAYVNIDEKIKESNQSRADMIDLMLYFEDNKDKIPEEKLSYTLSQTNFDFKIAGASIYRAIDCNNKITSYISSYTNEITAEYELTNIQSPYGFLANDLYFSAEEFSSYGFDINTDKHNNITLDEFLSYGVHYNACYMHLREYNDEPYDITFAFLIKSENSETQFLHINFKDEICNNYYITDFYYE